MPRLIDADVLAEELRELPEFAGEPHTLKKVLAIIRRQASDAPSAAEIDWCYEAMIHYAEEFYGVAMEHGMRAAHAADRVKHVVNAATTLRRYAITLLIERKCAGLRREGEADEAAELLLDEHAAVNYELGFGDGRRREASEADLEYREACRRRLVALLRAPRPTRGCRAMAAEEGRMT